MYDVLLALEQRGDSFIWNFEGKIMESSLLPWDIMWTADVSKMNLYIEWWETASHQNEAKEEKHYYYEWENIKNTYICIYFVDFCRSFTSAFLCISVYTPEQLAEKYSNVTFLFYCVILILIVAVHHSIYRWVSIWEGADWFSFFVFVIFYISELIRLELKTTVSCGACRRGELLVAVSNSSGHDLRPYWHMLLPFSYAMVSGAVGSCSVLFAKSL